jgi:glycosyltransferase involved in cell wall biosynthesis
MKVTILMPALNEEQAISETIKNIPREEIENLGFEMEILVIDGGSIDKTKEIALNLGAKVLRCGRGYGKQYKFGFEKSEGDIIVTADSDNSYPMKEIPDLIGILEKEKLDFISTNRFSGIRPGSMRPLNNLGNRMLTLAVNFLFSLKLKDSQSGMWIFRKDILKKIALASDGMALSQEIKIESFKKLKAEEINSSYYKRNGETKLRMFKDGWLNLAHMIKKRSNFS